MSLSGAVSVSFSADALFEPLPSVSCCSNASESIALLDSPQVPEPEEVEPPKRQRGVVTS